MTNLGQICNNWIFSLSFKYIITNSVIKKILLSRSKAKFL